MLEATPYMCSVLLGFADTHACRRTPAPRATAYQLPRLVTLTGLSVLYDGCTIIGKKILKGNATFGLLLLTAKNEIAQESTKQALTTAGCYITGKLLYYIAGHRLLSTRRP